MKRIKNISRKSLVLLCLAMLLMSYCFPVMVFGVYKEWEETEFNWEYVPTTAGGEYKDKKYSEIPDKSVYNSERAHIAYSGTLMQAYILNQLLKSEKITYEASVTTLH